MDEQWRRRSARAGSVDLRPVAPAGELQAGVAALAALALPQEESECVETLRALEGLKGAAAAAQARVTAQLHGLRSAAEAERDVPARERCRGLGAEVALARRESPHRGGRHLGMARALVLEMPHALRALTEGRISEEHATVLVAETAWLEAAHRTEVDALMAPSLGTTGVRRLGDEARAHALRLDQASAVERRERSVAQRRVAVRPAPAAAGAAMAYLSALLPLEQAVAAYAGLMRDAATVVGTGDLEHAAAHPSGRARTRDQVAADLLVERVTGQTTAVAVPIELHLVMTDRSLLGRDGTPAWLPGHGPLPARVARRLVDGEASGEALLTLRRLYTAPESGQLVAMESRARIFPPLLRRMVTLRDDRCRTPFCDAPIRHLDHATPRASGGPTHWDNASGLCERCNHVKELPGWHHRADRGTLEVIPPAGRAVGGATVPLVRGAGSVAGLSVAGLSAAWWSAAGLPRTAAGSRRRRRLQRLRRSRRASAGAVP